MRWSETNCVCARGWPAQNCAPGAPCAPGSLRSLKDAGAQLRGDLRPVARRQDLAEQRRNGGNHGAEHGFLPASHREPAQHVAQAEADQVHREERHGGDHRAHARAGERLGRGVADRRVHVVQQGRGREQRDRNETLAVLDTQIKEGLDGVTGEQLSKMVLAYEPVWAIGTGRNATPAQAGEAHFHIRQRLKQWFGLDASERCRVLYGGSVKPDNIAKLIAEPDLDGALVGGASLDPKSFFAIIKASERP